MSDGIGSMVRSYVSEALQLPAQIFGIFIDGVEVTQAIQYRRAEDHLTDPADRGPDNSIRLVAEKPAYVRVYVRSNLTPVPGVIGTVTIQKPRYGVWRDAGTLPQRFPATITADSSPVYATERGSLGNSLNFVISAGTMRGLIRLKVRVEVPDNARFMAESDVDLDPWVGRRARQLVKPGRYRSLLSPARSVMIASRSAACCVWRPVRHRPASG